MASKKTEGTDTAAFAEMVTHYANAATKHTSDLLNLDAQCGPEAKGGAVFAMHLGVDIIKELAGAVNEEQFIDALVTYGMGIAATALLWTGDSKPAVKKRLHSFVDLLVDCNSGKVKRFPPV